MTEYRSVIHLLEQVLPVVTEQTELEQSQRLAAVLILLFPHQNELNVLLTRRSQHLSNHAGQISFPGGGVEPNDRDIVHTALRESHEEVGLPSDDVKILGGLNPLMVPSGFAISPVVGTIENAPLFRANPAEVDEVFSIPLSFLLQKNLFQQGFRDSFGVKRSFYHFDFKDKYIWGATASMLKQLSEFMQLSLNDKPSDTTFKNQALNLE